MTRLPLLAKLLLNHNRIKKLPKGMSHMRNRGEANPLKEVSLEYNEIEVRCSRDAAARHLGDISAAPRRHLGGTSAASRLNLWRTVDGDPHASEPVDEPLPREVPERSGRDPAEIQPRCRRY